MLRESNAAQSDARTNTKINKTAKTKINSGVDELGSKVRPLRDARASVRLAPTVAGVPTDIDDRATVARMTIRESTRQQYKSHLNTATSKMGDVYSQRTIDSYLEAVKLLGEYLEEQDFDGDYVDVDVDILNGFLADYRRSHTQGGTNTKLRRLRNFFGWLEETFDTPNPYKSPRLAYYAPSEPAPSALGSGVAIELLEVCQSVRGSDTEYEDVRDTAMIEMLRTGVRRGELEHIYVEDIDFGAQVVQTIALKGSRRNAGVLRVVDGQEQREGRFVPLSDDAILAVRRWLRIRAHHRYVIGADKIKVKRGVGPSSGPLWYGTRGRGPMTGSGILQMVKRRAREAGYDPDTINVHAFRHTRGHQLKAQKIPDGDIMAVMGWSDRAMLDRYAKNLEAQRAIDHIREAGLA